VEFRKIVKVWEVIVVIIFFHSCSKELDFSGFFYSRERVNERFGQSMAWNSLNGSRDVISAGESYSFMTVGDTHVGGTDNLDRALELASDTVISFLVHVGDLTTGKKEDYELFYEHVSTRLTAPFFPVAGNHDLYFNGWEHYTSYFGSSTYTFTVYTPSAADLFICLDTGSGTLGDRQLNWLKNILETTRQNYRYCFVFSHTNFFREHRTTSTNLLAEELHYLLDLFADTNVNVVVMGHDHRRSSETFGNTLYLTLDALEDGFAEASFATFTIDPETISHSFTSVP